MAPITTNHRAPLALVSKGSAINQAWIIIQAYRISSGFSASYPNRGFADVYAMCALAFDNPSFSCRALSLGCRRANPAIQALYI
jgi:hypothetical protein